MAARETFQSRFGFILACVGSAVGMANIWAFPIQVGKNGGAVFILIYLFFIALFSHVGLSAEFAIGRRTGTGTLGSYENAWKDIGRSRLGYLLAWLPLAGSLTIAIGYAVITGWVLRTFGGVITGDLFTGGANGIMDAGKFFNDAAGQHFGSVGWHTAVVVITLLTLFLGAKSIERSNKIMMPVFFILFLLLAVRVAFLPGAIEGYRHLFIPRWEYLFKANTWIFAMGQALFSLSITGSGMIAYGRYLQKDVDIVKAAHSTAIFDTVAAMIAALVIIPAGAAFGVQYTGGGPGLMFVTLPGVLAQIPFGRLLAAFFFISVLFAAISSLQNMYEAVAESLINRFQIPRLPILIGMGLICLGVGVFIENGDSLGPWMDVVSIYIIPAGAVLGAISWFFLQKKEHLLDEINTGAARIQGAGFITIGRYIYVPLVLMVCALSILHVL
ncbi:sodium-dependent transporter [Desulforhopalus vacuolatus]|uniref:sodium-dependent transporter n=1 Tax=Desulforhopalus vacuolatus TaxID=40414 RepID=UPI001966CDC2|nr:sodium-dependent transporter [Desulforhopalus vacuolatus]MBM9521107.1 sodium-dependent transporter [Desulforhopalus vacuolatus]